MQQPEDVICTISNKLLLALANAVHLDWCRFVQVKAMQEAAVRVLLGIGEQYGVRVTAAGALFNKAMLQLVDVPAAQNDAPLHGHALYTDNHTCSAVI